MYELQFVELDPPTPEVVYVNTQPIYCGGLGNALCVAINVTLDFTLTVLFICSLPLVFPALWIGGRIEQWWQSRSKS